VSDASGSDRAWMERALELARRGWGTTHPNPMVGAVIVENGAEAARGWHARDGGEHAEAAALRDLGRAPRSGATLYATLEPCSTDGRTGACTEAIARAGVRRVVVGARDPNPAHAGAGIERLRAAGVEVLDGVLAGECEDLNLIFNHWIVAGRPLAAAKCALTLDGKFAARTGHSRWVTGEAARADVMRWRRLFPAIAVSAGTALRDNPRLTSRMKGGEWCPRRFVLDRDLETAREGAALPALYADEHRGRTTAVCAADASPERRGRVEAAGATVWALPEPCPDAFVDACGRAGIPGVYFEPGPNLVGRLFDRGTLDYLFVYTAPKWMGDACAPGAAGARAVDSMDQAIALRGPRHAVLGEDVLTRGHVVGPGSGASAGGSP